MNSENRSFSPLRRSWNILLFVVLLLLSSIALILISDSKHPAGPFLFSHNSHIAQITLGVIVLGAIEVFVAFVRRKPQARTKAIAFCFALFLYEDLRFIQLILIPIPDFSPPYLLIACFLGTVWFWIWGLYLFYSKQIDNFLPQSERNFRLRDLLTALVIIALLTADISPIILSLIP